MAEMPDGGRQAAHILLDMVSVFDPAEEDGATMALALKRMNEVGAFSATMDDETDSFDLDASGLIGGPLITIQRLITLLAEARGVEQTEIILELREFLDS